jgi:drug/metabolite transporter (DMT)-like permease
VERQDGLGDVGERAGSRSGTRVVLAFLAVYLIWGSTYLAIRFAIETIPPLLMAAARNLLAGGALYLWAHHRGAVRPTALHWRAAAIVGGLLLLGGNGAVVWAEQHVPSGLTALLVAMVPVWMVLLNWWHQGGTHPGARVFIGLALGFAGMAVLVGPEHLMGADHVDHLGAAVLALGTLSWAIGSLYSRTAPLPPSPLLATAMEMLCGGGMLALAGTGRGEWAAVDLGAVSLRSSLSFAYLVVFGSLVAFTAYVWLLRVTSPARVSTYAFVNPVVAVLLGWALAGEPLAARTMLATVVIVAAVAFITWAPVRTGGRGRA